MAIAPRAIHNGEMPIPSLTGSTGGTGVGGGGAVCATGAGASTAGSTHPAAPWAAAVVPAEPHRAAAGADWVRTDKAAHGSTRCADGIGAVAATAPVELTSMDPATTNATAGLNRKLAIFYSPWHSGVYPQSALLLSPHNK